MPMPSEFMEAPPSSILAEEDQVLPNERKIGFWKTDGMAENYGVKVGGNSLASLSMEKQMSSDSHILKQLDVPNIYINRDNNYQVSLENNTLGSGRTVGQRLQRPLDNNKGNTPNLGMDRKSYLIAGNKHNVMSDHYENGLFSSSLSDIFSRKLRLSANNNTMYGHSVGASQYEEEPFESIEEIEAQTIGNLLPDDDDLLSGVTDGLDYMVKPGSGDDAEEMDVFSSIGGMELGEDVAGQLDDGEHPSRTLLVKNINSDVDDSEIRMLFEQYGEIQTLYTASKHHGFVMISYYDIRATRRAMQALQNKLLGHRKLDIRYSVPDVRVTPGSHMGIPASVSNSFSSIIGMESGGMPSSLQNQLKYDFRTTSNYHPHSLPEYQDGLSNNIQCNSPSSMAASLNARMSGRVGNWQFDRNGGPIRCEPNDNVFGPSGNASSPATQRYMWNASRQPQPQPHNMIWPSSPTLMNGVPSRMANSFLHINNHHVGSAPSVNPSIWDRRNNYAGESPDPPGFHPGSLGNMRVPGNSPHPLDFIPHNMFPRMGGNSIDLSFPSNNTALASHHQNNVIFPSRGQMMPMMSSFDSPSDRSRIRRNEGNSNQTENKKQFELDLDRIMRGEDRRTTLMIKNIPNKYTSKMLLASIDERHRGTYDFIYLPIDFKNKCNVGYAFINMTEPKLIIPFYQAFNGKKWEKFNSEKVAYLAYGRIQGKSALVAHFQNSSLMNEDKRCRPILFHTDGPNAGDQVPFPMGGNVRSRVNKNRNEDVGNTEASSTSSGSTKDFE